MARSQRRARRHDSDSNPSQRRLRLEALEDRLALTTFTVGSLADGPVNLNDATVTLRDAIEAANNDVAAFPGGIPGGVGIDTIFFQAGLNGTITLQGQLGLRSRLTITGPGANLLTVSGGAAALSRVFDVNNSTATAALVTINGLTITGGGSPGSSGVGGGIFNQENLTVQNCTITGNTAGDIGGGIYNTATGTLTVRNCTISGNVAGITGGGISNKGQALVENSSFNGNEAVVGGGISNNGTLTIKNSILSGNDAGGGGIHNAGTLTVQNSTISANGFNLGGGIYNSGVATVQNSTISGNSGFGNGGGIYNIGSLTLQNATITQNHADHNNTGSTQGGGIFSDGFFAITMHNTIVADNFRGSGTATEDDIVGDPVSGTSTNNLIGTGGSGSLANGVNGNQVGVANPQLGPLQLNGGMTLTHALLTGSPAINAGNNAQVPAGLTTDQRGGSFARIVGTIVDIGAFEEQLVEPALLGDYNQNNTVDAADYTIWRDTRGSTTDLRANGDDSNSVIDMADYGVWTANFGDTLGSGASEEERGASVVDAAFAQFDGPRPSLKSARINHVPTEPDNDSLLLLATSFVESDRDEDDDTSMVVYDGEDAFSDDDLALDESLMASLLLDWQ